MTATATIPTVTTTTSTPSAAQVQTTPDCEHAWTLDSRHTTSTGIVRYTSCVRCRAHRVDLFTLGAITPTPISRVIEQR